MKKHFILILTFFLAVNFYGCKTESTESTVESYLQENSVINYEETPYYYFNDPAERFNNDMRYISEYNAECKRYSFDAGCRRYSDNDDGDTLIYRDYLNGVEITGFEGWDTYIRIPATIEGKAVIKIGGSFFTDEKTGEPMFHGCFFGRTEVREIFIPLKVKEIVFGALNIKGLELIDVDEKNPYYSSKDGILYNKDGTAELCVPDNYIKPDKSYESIPGYMDYISDRFQGDFTSFCGTPGMSNNEKAKDFYRKNVRKSGNYLVTNYLDGICINKVIDMKKWDCKIPEQIEGLPVVKLGSWLDDENNEQPYASIDFNKSNGKPVRMSKTVKYIDRNNLDNGWVYIYYYPIDKDNPYYAADEDAIGMYAIENGVKYPAYYNMYDDYGVY